jgi:predicted small lipoprotein YifL
MKKTITLTLALALSLTLAACGSNAPSGDTPPGNGGTTTGDTGNSNDDQVLITEDRTTADGSIAREQYYAETVRDEYTFDSEGTLTGYKTIYTFENGVNDEQKQDALDTLIQGDFTASIVGSTIMVDGNGNYLGFPYADSNLTEIKDRLDEKGYKYNLGPADKVTAPTQRGSGDTVNINTVEGRLSKAGLKLEDIKPDTFAEASLYNCDKDEIVMYLTNGKDKLGTAVMKSLVEKILNATATVADDGKYWDAYYGLGDPKELDLSKANYDAWMFIAQWSYKTDGKWITATLGILPAEEPEGQDNYSWEVTLAFNY